VWEVGGWCGENGDFEISVITLVDFEVWSELADRMLTLEGDLIDELEEELGDKLFAPGTDGYEKLRIVVLDETGGEVSITL